MPFTGEVPVDMTAAVPPPALQRGEAADGALLATAVLVHGDVSREALELGIPKHALPPLPSPLTVAGVRAATDLLQRIIASRLSSNL